MGTASWKCGKCSHMYCIRGVSRTGAESSGARAAAASESLIRTSSRAAPIRAAQQRTPASAKRSVRVRRRPLLGGSDILASDQSRLGALLAPAGLRRDRVGGDAVTVLLDHREN